jgi:putative flippase GtrA
MNPNSPIRAFVLYLLVGAIATIAEWAAFYVLETLFGMPYLYATALAFVLSTFVNWLAGIVILFKPRGSLLADLAKVYLASIAGLIFNLGLMWLFVDCMHLPSMLSKILATGIVFVWNFLIRRFVIYKNQ